MGMWQGHSGGHEKGSRTHVHHLLVGASGCRAEPVRLCSTEHMDLRALHWELHMHRLLLRDHKPQPLSFLQAGCQLDPLQEGLHLSIRNGQLRVSLMGRRRKEGT